MFKKIWLVGALILIILGAGYFLVFSKNKTSFENNFENAKTTSDSSVPLPSQEDTIRLFFELINEGRASEAVEMLNPEDIEDDSVKQSWGVQFNAFENIKVKKIELYDEDFNEYEVVLDVKMKAGSENVQPMPYYGFGNGEFTRWVSLIKAGNLWRIDGIATGP
jgi:hypothetical protein